jgi:hypothetical protein
LLTTATSLIPGGAPYLATHGIDLTGVAFSATAFRSTGFSVDGTGALISAGLTANGTISGTGVASLFASPPAIGGTAANTGHFTSVIVSSPVGNDPLAVTVASGAYARINYTVTGTRSWTMGVFPTGSFILSDESVGPRIAIDTTGLTAFSGHVALQNGLEFGSTLASSMTDLTKHINLYGGGVGMAFSAASILSFVTSGGGAFVYMIGGAAVAGIGAGAISVSGNNVIGARKTGWAAPTGTATRTTFATGSVTLPLLAERVKALIDDLTAHGMIGA